MRSASEGREGEKGEEGTRGECVAEGERQVCVYVEGKGRGRVLFTSVEVPCLLAPLDCLSTARDARLESRDPQSNVQITVKITTL